MNRTIQIKTTFYMLSLFILLMFAHRVTATTPIVHSLLSANSSMDLGLDVDSACADDMFEPNDDANDGLALLSLPSSPYTGLMSCIDNADYYPIVIPANTTLQIDILFSHVSSDINAFIFAANNSDGSHPIQAYSTSLDDNELFIIANPTASATIYYLGVFNEGRISDTPYSIMLTSVAPCQDDAVEDNDWAPEATPIVIGGTLPTDLMHCPLDSDVFSVSVPPQTTIEVALLFQHNISNLELAVHALSGWTEIARAETTTNNESITFTNDSENVETYYIGVFSNEARGYNPYTLEISSTVASSVFLPLLTK